MKIGSESEKRTRVGFSHLASAARTSVIFAALGCSSSVGTSSGNASTPAFDSGVGKGALYASTTSSASSVTAEMRMSWPGTRSVPRRRTNSRKRNHSSDGARPAPIPVLRITRRETRSGRSTASRSPIGPPQSWTTTVVVTQVELVGEALDRRVVEVVRVVLDPRRLVRAAEAEVVGREGATDAG